MSFSKPRLLTLALGCLTIAIAAAAPARAATCGDSDCGKGFTCVTTPVAVPEPAKAPCPLDAPCAVTDPAAPAVDAGAPTTESFCVAASCTTDGDCGAGMICHTSTEECGGTIGGCAAGTKCDPVPSTTCSPHSISTCAYKWQVACNVDADCGDGFTCMPTPGGECSGGSGVGTTSSGSASTGSVGGTASSEPNIAVPAVDGGSAPHDTCTTTTSFPGYCQAKIKMCASASDCPAAWTCAPQAVEVGVATSGPASASDGGAANTSSTIAPSEPAPTSTTPPATTMVCTPPGGGGYLSPGEITNGGGAPTAAGTGGTNGQGTGGTGTKGTTTPTASGASSTSSSGCALGGRPGSRSLGLTALALLGLAAARRRR